MQASPDAAGESPLPSRPQFGLRTMFAATTGICLLLGLQHWFGPIAAIGVAFVLLMVGLHVAGNALGARLQASAHEAEFGRSTPAAGPSRLSPFERTSPPSYPIQRLAQRTGWTLPMAVLSAVGLILGGIAGGLTLAAFGGPKITAAGISLGAGSSALLGALAGFLAASFLTTTHRALDDATAELRRRK